MPMILLISTFGPAWLEGRATVRRYAVIDHSGWLLEAIDQRSLAADLYLILRRTSRLAKTNPIEFANLPSVLQDPVKALSAVGEFSKDAIDAKLIRSVAMSAAGVNERANPRLLQESLPPQDAEELERAVSALARWWHSLPQAEAARVSPESSRARFARVAVRTGDARELNGRIEDGSLFAYLLLPENPVADADHFTYVSDNVTDRSLLDWFRALASEEIKARRLEREGINPLIGEWIQRPIQVQIRKTTGEGGDRAVGDQDLVSQWLPMAISFILWLAVFGVSQMLLTNTIEEKSNRVLEILLSSISPLQLMAGKIAGIALTGLTILSGWSASLLVVGFLLADPGIGPTEVNPTPIMGAPLYLASFLLYFILGYLFYATLLVGIGSICNTLKEAQNLMIPVSLLLFMPVLSMLPVAKDPNGDLAMVLSFIPPFTPFVMMNRAAGPPAVWEYVLSSIILVVSIAGLFWGAAKVFRVGILMTSQRPSLRSMLGWLRAPVGLGKGN